ncbi:MAG: hypothetical protein K5924_03690 [Chloroflexi bacterium]|nr:hypothetical protein [Chloroflexota bacterium]
MRLAKTFGFAGAMLASALLGGTIIGSTLATDEPTDVASGSASVRGEYCETFLDTFASELGTDRDGLVVAGQVAANAAVDAAVEAGDLTEERAAMMRERIAAYDGSGCGLGFGFGFAKGFHAGAERGFARGFLGGNVLESAADALGIESSAVIEQARDAGSLEALAEAEGVVYADVKASVIAAVQADLDAAVAEGMAQERADAAIERVTTWLDEGGSFEGRAGGFGPRGGHHGPWGDRGSSDSNGEETGS